MCLFKETLYPDHTTLDIFPMQKVITHDELLTIPGVGKSIAQDLRDIGINNVADLITADPEDLYERSNFVAGTTQDRCLLYVFRCAVYFAKTKKPDPKKLQWWYWKDQPKEPSSYYLYVLHCADDTLYTGITTDIPRRISEHSTGALGAKYTAARRPVKLLYTQKFPDRSSASKAESRVKKMTRVQKREFLTRRGITMTDK